MWEVFRENAELHRVLSRTGADEAQKPAASDHKPFSRETTGVPECAVKIMSMSCVPRWEKCRHARPPVVTDLSAFFILAAPKMTLLFTRFLLKTVME